ncbi:diacylglycerol kinase eta isoform X1 [Bemisia tabaci]
MDDWNSSKTPSNQDLHNDKPTNGDPYDFLSGRHVWYPASHARPIYCNICRDGLSGITSHGYSCEVCKMKIHKTCKTKTLDNCKWTTLASIGRDIIEDQYGNILMPHQWIEGNLPVSSKCSVCDKTCGSVLRLQDWRCLWCKLTVHDQCRPGYKDVCMMGPCKISVVPPTAIHSVGIDDSWETIRPREFSPLLVFVNSKSGDNHGVKFLRRFKQLLNPAQVFDLITGGPNLGLRLFRRFDPFRILICSGDGSVGWVLSEIDKLGLHNQCQVGVLPLGTGNDLARVLGWGSSCDDEANLQNLVERYERAGTKVLDRWSVMTFERGITVSTGDKSTSASAKTPNQEDNNIAVIAEYEQTISTHLAKILFSDNPVTVIKAASALCEAVKDFTLRITESSLVQNDDDLSEKCHILKRKLDILLDILHEEQVPNDSSIDKKSNEYLDVNQSEKPFISSNDSKDYNNKPPQDQILQRTNSLKRAVRKLIEPNTKLEEELNHTNMVHTVNSSPEKSNFSRMNSTRAKGRKSLQNNEFTYQINPKLLKDEINYRTTENRDKSLDVNKDHNSPASCLKQEKNLSASCDNNLECLSSVPSVKGRSKSLDYHDNEDEFDDDDSIKFDRVPSALSEEMLSKLNHIDSSETSDDNPETVLSATFSAKSTEVDTTENGRKFADCSFKESRKEINRLSITKRLETDSIDNPADTDELDATLLKQKRCSIAHFIEGHDIGKKSIKCKHERYNRTAKLDSAKGDNLEKAAIIDEAIESEKQCQFHKEDIDRNLVNIINEIDLKLLNSLDLPIELFDKLEKRFDYIMGSQNLSSNKTSTDNLSVGSKSDKPDFLQNQLHFLKVDHQITAGSDSSIESKTPKHRFITVKDAIPNSNGNLTNGSSCDRINESLSLDTNRHSSSSDMAAEVPSKNNLTRSETGPPNAASIIGPTVVINPPSPSLDSRRNSRNNILPEFRRYSYDSCRRLSAASPLTLLHASCPARRISNISLLHPESMESQTASSEKRSRKIKALPIINPLVRLSMWPNVSGTSLISNVLLANADALCAPAVPLMDPDESIMEGYRERVVMNNYFGIGIDAQISLDFHNKREEHPEKCKSRARNYMWYGVLGSKQWLQKTYKNLEQRVQLECDGYRIPLPHLQGIVILNIPSFMGGTNFWGGTKEDEVFIAPAVDDEILEVVAVFGSVQMAASRLINLQHHRIAQCRSVQIIISGDEGVPIQVDGEAWVQPPGMIRIIHKNRIMMLCRNKSLERTLKTWEDTLRHLHRMRSRATSTTMPPAKLNAFTEEELQLLLGFIDSAASLVKCIKLITINNPSLKNELYDLAFNAGVDVENVHPGGRILEGVALRIAFTKLFFTTKQLYDEIHTLHDKFHNLRIQPELESQLTSVLINVELDLKKCHIVCSPLDQQELVYLTPLSPEETKANKTRKGRFRLLFRRSSSSKASNYAIRDPSSWSVNEVCAWLESIQLSEYMEIFQCHDIRGKELLVLSEIDLKKMGITKVGHVIRIQQAVKDVTS